METKAKNTADLTDEELKQYEHLAYEVWMLREVAELAVQRLPENQVVENVYVESFCLHFRNIASFFWPGSKPHATDVLARHFVKGSGWNPVKPPNMGDHINRVHREVAHLTTHRIAGKPPRKAWPFRKLILALLPTLEEFVRCVAPERLSPQVAKRVRDLRTLTAQPILLGATTSLTTSSITSIIIGRGRQSRKSTDRGRE